MANKIFFFWFWVLFISCVVEIMIHDKHQKSIDAIFLWKDLSQKFMIKSLSQSLEIVVQISKRLL